MSNLWQFNWERPSRRLSKRIVGILGISLLKFLNRWITDGEIMLKYNCWCYTHGRCECLLDNCQSLIDGDQILSVVLELDELELLERCASSLSKFGKVELVYITAEFQPFSNQRRPDLLLRPFVEQWEEEQLYFVELRINLPTRYLDNLSMHLDFVQESLGHEINFVFATSAIVSARQKEKLIEQRLTVLDAIQSPDDFVRRLLSVVNRSKQE